MTIFDIIANTAAELHGLAAQIHCPDSEGGKVAAGIKSGIDGLANMLSATMSPDVSKFVTVGGILGLAARDLDGIAARVSTGTLIQVAAAAEVTQIANRLRAELAPEPPSGTGGQQG